jgi:3-oxoacyl-(acyl-carrier-protein) synthase
VSRVFVTGIGIISAVGSTLMENRSALAAGRSGISFAATLSSRYAGVLPCGSIGTSTDEWREQFRIDHPGITRTTLLALHAFSDAIADAGLSDVSLRDPRVALVGATTVGGMCLTDELYRDTTRSCDNSPYLSSYDCASVHLFLQSRYGMTGLGTTINTACSSSANAIQYGARLIRNGLATTVIAGGADSLAKFTINGFHALQILSPKPCRPFDRDRSGLNLGEGAAFLVLEGEEVLAGKEAAGGKETAGGRAAGRASGKPIYAELTGYCNTNDAFHPSALSPTGDGPFLAMQGALQSAGLKPADIDFINTHGTATENNDEAEGRAMLRVFGELPPFASTKSYTGHTLGAAGAIEAVYSILSIRHQELYASLNFAEPIEDMGIRPVQVFRQHAVRHVMSNSFGFGGNCTSLIFSNVN